MVADLKRTSHRPWPLPDRPWIMRMRWESLAFLHWRVPVEEIARRLPTGLQVDRFDGDAWIGIVPFAMRSVRPRFTFDVPGLSHFPELNVRTYVTDGEKPGVWFFSLDAHNRIAVRAARAGFHLPYFDARIRCAEVGGSIEYESVRVHRGAAEATFRARYAPAGTGVDADDPALRHWLTERYCLYAASPRGQVLRGEVHHAPWSLRSGEVEIEEESLLVGDGLPPVEGAPLVHVADPIDVVAWAPERVLS